MDKRQQKTQARLFETILDLAASHPAAELTMSEIAAHAKVHRSTLYEHASSPADLLQSALRTELDVLRSQYLDDVSPADAAAAVRAVTLAVLQHIDEHAVIYARGLGSASESASLHSMLASHFRVSTKLLLEQHSLTIPFAVDGVDEETLGETAAQYVAHGTVGAIEVWLRGPEPRHPSTFVAVFEKLIPSWWAGNSDVS